MNQLDLEFYYLCWSDAKWFMLFIESHSLLDVKHVKIHLCCTLMNKLNNFFKVKMLSEITSPGK